MRRHTLKHAPKPLVELVRGIRADCQLCFGHLYLSSLTSRAPADEAAVQFGHEILAQSVLTSLYSLIALRRSCGSAWTAGVITGAGETVELDRVRQRADLTRRLCSWIPLSGRAAIMLICASGLIDTTLGDVRMLTTR